MAQKIFYELLRPIPTHTEVPSNFEKIEIALLIMAQSSSELNGKILEPASYILVVSTS